MAADARGQHSGSAGVWPRGCLPLVLAGVVLWASAAFLGVRWTAAVLALVTVGAVVLRWRWRRWFPHRATRELNKVIGRARLNGDARVIRRKCRRDGHQWTIAWRVPTGVTASALTNVAEVLEVALDCSAVFWYERGRMWMRAGTAHLPKEISFGEFYGE
jgi:hypothetical protein